ncbi:hypothetical protein L7F22_034171 [Adiantum nelumboides]|nr:hypothetical protein [Adiantum nelumboides]
MGWGPAMATPSADLSSKASAFSRGTPAALGRRAGNDRLGSERGSSLLARLQDPCLATTSTVTPAPVPTPDPAPAFPSSYELLSSSAGASSPDPSHVSPDYRPKWSMLLSTEALEDALISRAGSVTDAHVLRRKGRLKEQDGLIEFIISMHATHSPTEVMEKMERWIREHFEDPRCSLLKKLVPSIGRFHSHLLLVQALQEYDQFSSLSRRKYVPPNFAEIRHVLNIAQVHASAEHLSLITFDADGTLYADGHHIERDNKMICHVIKLLQHGAHVAIVTAAGYPGEPEKFETRFAGLLAAFEDLGLPQTITSLFHIMGEFIRKPRAVGVIPKEPTIYEVLEEMALTVQVQLVGAKLPFCAFNGGKDVFVDVGNKSVGLGALMMYLKKKPCEMLHVGDRFTISGNDAATRSKCPILWVANPEETAFYTRMLLRDIHLARLTPYIE